VIKKKARIEEMGELKEGSWKWKLEWRKQWFEWEKCQLATLMDEMENYTL